MFSFEVVLLGDCYPKTHIIQNISYLNNYNRDNENWLLANTFLMLSFLFLINGSSQIEIQGATLEVGIKNIS